MLYVVLTNYDFFSVIDLITKHQIITKIRGVSLWALFDCLFFPVFLDANRCFKSQESTHIMFVIIFNS